MLGIYTLIFGGLFQLRLSYDSSISAFSLYVFCGIVVWLAISEGINRCTTVIAEHTSLVKKVIFPAELLPLQVILAAIVQQLIGLAVLMAGMIVMGKDISWTWLLSPLLLLPQFLITAGIGWLVASVAVFIKDTRQVVSLVTLCWMFLTPIFYPAELFRTAFDGRYAFWLIVNPIAALIHNYRQILLRGEIPSWNVFLYTFLLGVLLFLFGLWWFTKTKRSFVDVI